MEEHRICFCPLQKVCECDSDSDCADDGFFCAEDCKCEAKPASCNCSGDADCGATSKCIDCNCEVCPKSTSTEFVVNPPLTFVVDTTESVEPDKNSIMNLTRAVVNRIQGWLDY